MKKLIILGYARHGKTTVQEILKEKGFKIVDQTEYIVEKILVPSVYPTREEALQNKFKDRALWFEKVNEYNSEEPSRLQRELFECGSDVHVGMRNIRELKHAKENLNVISAWVQDTRKSPESENSCNIQPNDADYILDNSGTLEDLSENINELLSLLRGKDDL